jgi:hypothetical protein
MNAPERTPGVTYEEDRVPARLILRVLTGLVAVSVGLCIVAYLLVVMREEQLRPERRFPEKALGPPRRIAEVRAEPFDLPRPAPSLSERQRARISSYGWVDDQRGLVRIPVDAAIDLELRAAREHP